MTTIEGEAPLSPTTEAKINLIRQAVRTGEAQLKEDSQGRIQIAYANERTIPLSHVDKSKAHVIQVGKDADDTGLRVDVWLEYVKNIKWSRAPSGVVIDPTKVGISPSGQYTEGQQFKRLEEVLGKGKCAGIIAVTRDKKTGTEHAMKTLMISVFCPNEVHAWRKLGNSDHFPSLYLLRLDGNKIVFHMEKVEHGVTLTDIIDSHMVNLHLNAPELIRPFSLCMFHSLLSAVGEMHDKNWAHCDLHGGNVMITKDAMMLKILDFGMAQPLREGSNFNHDALKNDILNAICLFCGVYIWNDFKRWDKLESEIKAETLKEVLKETARLGEKEREELLELITMTYQVTQNPQQAGYGSTARVMERIENKLFPDEKMDVMMQAAKVLFPEFYGAAKDIALGEKEAGVTTGDSVPEEAAEEIPDDFQGLSISS